MQILVILFVGVYQLWYAQGYQEFAGIESSVTTKVKLSPLSSIVTKMQVLMGINVPIKLTMKVISF